MLQIIFLWEYKLLSPLWNWHKWIISPFYNRAFQTFSQYQLRFFPQLHRADWNQRDEHTVLPILNHQLRRIPMILLKLECKNLFCEECKKLCCRKQVGIFFPSSSPIPSNPNLSPASAMYSYQFIAFFDS